MKVGDSIKKLRDMNQKEVISPELKEVKESIDLSNQKTVNDKSSSGTVATTYKEIDKEDKTLVLNKESENKTLKAISESRKHLGKYLSGKAKIDEFARKERSATTSRRTRRSAPVKVFSPLTTEERKAFYEMYKLFESLEKDQENFLPRLWKIAELEAIMMPLKNKPSSSSLRNNLTAINWNNSGAVRYTTEKKGGHGRRDTPNSWTNWGSNPYKPFLKELGEYTELIDKVKKSEKEKEGFTSKRRFSGLMSTWLGPPTVRSAYSGLDKYENQVREAKERFTNKVALKFLEWMNQA